MGFQFQDRRGIAGWDAEPKPILVHLQVRAGAITAFWRGFQLGGAKRTAKAMMPLSVAKTPNAPMELFDRATFFFFLPVSRRMLFDPIRSRPKKEISSKVARQTT